MEMKSEGRNAVLVSMHSEPSDWVSGLCGMRKWVTLFCTDYIFAAAEVIYRQISHKT